MDYDDPDMVLADGTGIWHKLEGAKVFHTSVSTEPPTVTWHGNEVRATIRSYTGRLTFKVVPKQRKNMHRALIKYIKTKRKPIREMHTEYHRRKK